MFRDNGYESSAAEHQDTLLRDFLGFIGIGDPVFIRAEKTGFGPEARDQAIAGATAAIAKL